MAENPNIFALSSCWIQCVKSLGGGPLDIFGLRPIAQTGRGTIAQALVDSGFSDLAEELAELLRGGKKLELGWEMSIDDFPSLGDIVEELAQERIHRSKKGHKKVDPIGTRLAKFQITVAIEQTHEIVVENLRVSNLWTGAELILARRSEPTLTNDASQPFALPWLPFYKLRWKTGEMSSDIDGLAASLYDGLASDFKEDFPPEWLRSFCLSALLQRVLTSIPEVSYVGPIRISDDRNYAVDPGRRLAGVGRQGELTWVRLRELERPDSPARAWLEEQLGSVLQLTNVQTSRESPTKPRVTAAIGELKLPIHSYGLGTSQALPILVELALALPLQRKQPARRESSRASGFKLLVIEEPESHLHPAAQKALATAMVQFAARGGKLVVETHSEVILRAIELEIALQRITNKNCIANWIDHRPESLRGPYESKLFTFEPEGQLSEDLPPTFDQVVTELIERRLLKGK